MNLTTDYFHPDSFGLGNYFDKFVHM